MLWRASWASDFDVSGRGEKGMSRDENGSNAFDYPFPTDKVNGRKRTTRFTDAAVATRTTGLTVPMSDSFMSHRNVRGRGGDLVTFLAPLQIMSYMQWADVVFGPRAPSAGPPARSGCRLLTPPRPVWNDS